MASAPVMTPSAGYPRLAGLMATSGDATIFRQFHQLQIIRLLRLQATLQNLENEYKEILAEDNESGDPDRVNLVFDFHLMRELAQQEDGESEQHDILNKISQALDEYNKALTQYMTINQAPRPSQRDVKDLRSWLGRPSMGNSFLVGIEAQVWDDKNMTDFINPAVKKVDRFSALLTGPVLSGYHWLYGHKKQKQETNPYDIGENLRVYDEKGIYLFADVLAVVLSSLLPTLMILGLYFIQSMLWRIGCVIIFTAIFGATLTVFTNARKIEIYSATAAFAAVEVVFIGSTAGAV